MGAIARGFIAVEPPADVATAIAERVRILRASGHGEDLRWAGPGWHATLQFLGRVDDPDAIGLALERGLRHASPPIVRIGGGGAFPRARRGNVLWLGFTEGADELGGLAALVATATAPLGFDAEERRFTPHLTLARSGPARDLRALVHALGDQPVGREWHVDGVVVLSSDTRSDGARYSEVGRVSLGASPA